jgi:hypothetical protein
MNPHEKAGVQVASNQETFALESGDDAEAQGWDGTATKRLLSKLDWHILPFMSLIYL